MDSFEEPDPATPSRRMLDLTQCLYVNYKLILLFESLVVGLEANVRRTFPDREWGRSEVSMRRPSSEPCEAIKVSDEGRDVSG